jgi:hypothetical protein
MTEAIRYVVFYESGDLSLAQEAAEEFASGDPFVLNGVVSKWYIREWREVTP